MHALRAAIALHSVNQHHVLVERLLRRTEETVEPALSVLRGSVGLVKFRDQKPRPSELYGTNPIPEFVSVCKFNSCGRKRPFPL